MIKSIILAVAILVAIMNVPGINIHHWLNPPTFTTHKITSEYKFPFNRTTNIILDSEIKNQSTINEILSLLQTAKKGDVITFHLSGYGGNGQTMFFLISNIQQTKATVHMSVEAPVYSAHAYLALAGSTLKMSPNSFLMFHIGSSVDWDCSKKTKNYDPDALDRGIKSSIKCEQHKSVLYRTDLDIIFKLPLLTIPEKIAILAGQDVYITANEFYRRVQQ